MMDREPLRPLWMELDFEALAHNLGVVRRLAGRRRLIASVKANAYGHGAVAIARELTRLGVDTLWTGSIDEALAIGAAGVDARILLFGGYLPKEIPVLISHGFTPTICDRAGAEAVSIAASGPTPVYVKVDSGLGRLGVPLADAAELILGIAACPTSPSRASIRTCPSARLPAATGRTSGPPPSRRCWRSSPTAASCRR